MNVMIQEMSYGHNNIYLSVFASHIIKEGFANFFLRAKFLMKVEPRVNKFADIEFFSRNFSKLYQNSAFFNYLIEKKRKFSQIQSYRESNLAFRSLSARACYIKSLAKINLMSGPDNRNNTFKYNNLNLFYSLFYALIFDLLEGKHGRNKVLLWKLNLNLSSIRLEDWELLDWLIT